MTKRIVTEGFLTWLLGARRLGALLALAFVAGAAGCKASRVGGGPDPTPNTRMADAHQLSLRAQKAQTEGRADEAIELYRRALDLQPNMRGLWNNLGALLIERQAYLDAVEALKREAELSPDDPRPYANIGLAYKEAGFADSMLRYHLMALERDPNWIDSLRGVAQAARRLNKADEKIEETLKRGLMLERDPVWRSVFETERLRVEGQIKEQRENTRVHGAGPKRP